MSIKGLSKVLLLIFVFVSPLLQAQDSFKVMFYNAENLYDTINKPFIFDDDLTPEGHLHWNTFRYRKKLEDISKAISSLGGKYPPSVVGLCEVENKLVLDDLVERSSLAKHKYRYVVTDSKDSRGSNIAFLYQRDELKVLSQKSYTPAIDETTDRTTRDILHVVAKVLSGDTIDFFVCHYPSRSEGVMKSRPFRIKVSELLREKVDSLFKIRANANILIMGDFNDYPFDISMKDILRAKSLAEPIFADSLYNMFLHLGKEKKDIASYKYKGKWNYLDQFVISGNLLDTTNAVRVRHRKAYIYNPDFLLEEDEKYGATKPFRTFSGWTYLGGTSDHLPIYLDLEIGELGI